MTDDQNKKDDSSGEPTRVEFHLIKSNHFRVVHVDGGIGGMTGRRLCHIALYNERPSIPKVRVRDILESGELGTERTESVLGEPNVGVTREVEVDLLMDERTVRELHEWFGRQIKQFDELRAMDKDAEESDDG